ncbi:MAG: hypothetical protein L0H84_10310 [Pseudonocardia sp.]|nr:hypothetical protein [Pseudonocardia sp.]
MPTIVAVLIAMLLAVPACSNGGGGSGSTPILDVIAVHSDLNDRTAELVGDQPATDQELIEQVSAALADSLVAMTRIDVSEPAADHRARVRYAAHVAGNWFGLAEAAFDGTKVHPEFVELGISLSAALNDPGARTGDVDVDRSLSWVVPADRELVRRSLAVRDPPATSTEIAAALDDAGVSSRDVLGSIAVEFSEHLPVSNDIDALTAFRLSRAVASSD